MNKKIKVTNDITFQQIFGKAGNERITKAFLEKLLNKSINELTLDVNKQQLGEYYKDKVSVLDIRAREGDGSNIIIEMQVAKYPYMLQRLLYYWAKTYIKDLKQGEKYTKLNKTIAILIVEKNLPELKGMEEYHTKWKIKLVSEEKARGEPRILLDDLEIHIIELEKFSDQSEVPEKNWIKFIKEGEDMKNREEVEKEVQEAIEELSKILLDPELKEEYDAREQYLRDFISYSTWELDEAERIGKERGENIGREKGEKIGREKGEKIGREKGKEEAQKEIVQKLKTKKLTTKQIADMLDMKEERVNEFIRSEI